jgi:hypothetical protein
MVVVVGLRVGGWLSTCNDSLYAKILFKTSAVDFGISHFHTAAFEIITLFASVHLFISEMAIL